MRVLVAALLALVPTSKVGVNAVAPEGFETVKDRPGLPEPLRRGLAGGATFARSPQGLLSARAERSASALPECIAYGKLIAHEVGWTLEFASMVRRSDVMLDADDIAPTPRSTRDVVCVNDFTTGDGQVMREVRWKLNAKLNVTVRCLPFDDATAEACMSFAASVRPAR